MILIQYMVFIFNKKLKLYHHMPASKLVQPKLHQLFMLLTKDQDTISRIGNRIHQ